MNQILARVDNSGRHIRLKGGSGKKKGGLNVLNLFHSRRRVDRLELHSCLYFNRGKEFLNLRIQLGEWKGWKKKINEWR